MKALIIDQVSHIIEEFLQENGFSVDTVFLPTKDELCSLIGEYDLLVMRVDPKIDKTVLDHAAKLKLIAVSAVGTNHIDMSYAKEKGIKVIHANGSNSNAVAELTMSKMLDLARKTMPANQSVKKGIWNKYDWTGIELRGKTLGIIGFGAIGKRVSQLASGFEMRVLAYDPYLSDEVFAEQNVQRCTLLDLLKQSDVISLHVPLNETTKKMISYDEFAVMKKNAIVINMARGGILDEEAALKALKDGTVGGIAVDVMEFEYSASSNKGVLKAGSLLFAFDNFIVSPHIGGGGTYDSLDALGRDVICKISECFDLS